MKPKHPLRRFFPLSAIVMAGALCAPVASAAITVQNTAFNIIGNAAPINVTSQTISSFALSGGTKLVVTTGGEGANPTGVTFAGQALTQIEKITSGRTVSIWYLDSPTATTGDVVVTYTAATMTAGISALSMRGAALGVLDSSSATGANSGTLTIEAGSLVLGSFATNQNASLINPDDPSTDIFSAAIFPAGGSNVAASYFIEPDPAARTSFGFAGGAAGTQIAAAASFAVPEPRAALLGGLGLLMLLRRRSR